MGGKRIGLAGLDLGVGQGLDVRLKPRVGV